MPETPCEGCILRLRRQALEWGSGYRFHSCAMVNIVDSADACNGCSGHGRCVRGQCRCDSSEEDGFWYGEYCQNQNECDEDAHCGEGGVCVETGNITPPNKQCWCQEGYFGNVARPMRGSYISPRICNRSVTRSVLSLSLSCRESRLTLGDPETWADEYDFELASNPEGNFKMYYTVFPRRGEIEFAIRARTSNWAAFGFRPIAEGTTDTDDEEDSEGEEPAPRNRRGRQNGRTDAEEDEEGEAEGEESRRRSLKMKPRMPEIEEEATAEKHIVRSLLQRRRNNNEEDTEAEGEGDEEAEAEGEGDEETEAEGEGDNEETEAEGEGDEEAEAEGEGEGDGDDDALCRRGRPTTAEYDAGIHDLARPRRGRGLKNMEMPSLQSEKSESHKVKTIRSLKQEDEDSSAEGDTEEDTGNTRRRRQNNDSDEEAEAEGEGDDEETEAEGEGDNEEAEAEGEGDGESEAEGEGDDDEDYGMQSPFVGAFDSALCVDEVEAFVPELIAEGTECENVATTSAAHPMINQDIYVVYAKDGIFRIQDSFTPSRSKPLPDVYYGGDDGIIDAVGSEIDGFTNVKFRRRLESVDVSGDYCILEDVDYLVVYAYGQATRDFTHIPNSGLETGRASNRRFYGEDELKFHGGGIGTTFEGRGVLGAVNFFDEPPEERAEGEGCLESTMDDFDCMQEALNGDYILHWTVEDDGVRFACETIGTGWAALGWPETAGVMVGAEAVIGLGGGEDSVFVYVLEERAPTGITQTNDAFEIEDGEIEQGDDFTILRFKRLFDDDFDGTGEIDLIVAYNPTANDIVYHGPTSRGAISVVLS